MGREQINNENVSDLGVWHRLKGFLKAIEKDCKQKGVLSGTYAVSFDRAIEDYHRYRRDIQARIVDYISRTHDDDAAATETIRVGPKASCEIDKLHNQSDYIGMVKSGGSWDAEVGRDLCDILKEEIDDKIGKLQHINLPHILLLKDEFNLASPYVWLDCLNSYAPTKTFHTVFVVVPHRHDYIVYSQEANWPVLDRRSEYARFG